MEASLTAAYDLAQAARARGERFIRIEVEPKRRFMERFPRLWDGVLGKTMGRRILNEQHRGLQVPIVSMLIVEVGVADVFEAFRREKERELARSNSGPDAIAANKFTRPQKISTAR